MITHIISCSGGLGSAITADYVCNKYGKENVILLFADTLVEDADLYKFNEELVDLLGCLFVRIADGRTPWQVFNDVKFIGNTRIDPCSRVLKRDLIRKYLTLKDYREQYLEKELAVDDNEFGGCGCAL